MAKALPVVLVALVGALLLAAVAYVASRRPAPHVPAVPAVVGKAVQPEAEEAEATADDQRVPHPLFPTASSSGTAELFHETLPRIGPLEAEARRPPDAELRWTRHDHCELDPGGIVCGAPAGAEAVWRLGRGAAVLVAERRIGGLLHESVLVELDGTGRAGRLVHTDADGQVDRVRGYEIARQRYSERRRNGSNALQGCGFIALTAASGALRSALQGGSAAPRAGEAGEAGAPSSITCLQWSGRPMQDATSVVTRRLKRDRWGLVTRESRHGFDGEPVVGHDGVHQMVITRDGQGRGIQERGYDVAGRAVVSAISGCHGHRMVRDGRGLVTRRDCLGVNEQPAMDRAEVATVQMEHDARGCLVGRTYFDTHHRPVASVDGVRRVRLQVNRRCDVVRRSCHDEGRVPCGPGQPAELRFEVNARGDVVRARHFAADRSRASDPEYKVFELRYTLGPGGDRLSESCFGPAGARSGPLGCGAERARCDTAAVNCHDTGFHRVVSRHDALGRKVEDRFFDAAGVATTNFGTFVRQFRHDAYDHLDQTTGFDDQGRVVESLGAASRRYLYDTGHRLFGLLQLDAGGRPSDFRGCITGHTCPGKPWHAVRVVRSPKGRVLWNLFFDRSGRLIQRVRCAKAQCWS